MAGRFQNIFSWAVKNGKVWMLDVEGKGQKEHINSKFWECRDYCIGSDGKFASAIGASVKE